MRKIIMLFMLVAVIYSCSNDDTTNTTPLEGSWLLIHYRAGDPDHETDPSEVINENIQYHFTGTKYSITKDTETAESGTFTMEKENGYYILYLEGYTSGFNVVFHEDNRAIFNGLTVDIYIELKKI